MPTNATCTQCGAPSPAVYKRAPRSAGAGWVRIGSHCAACGHFDSDDRPSHELDRAATLPPGSRPHHD